MGYAYAFDNKQAGNLRLTRRNYETLQEGFRLLHTLSAIPLGRKKQRGGGLRLPRKCGGRGTELRWQRPARTTSNLTDPRRVNRAGSISVTSRLASRHRTTTGPAVARRPSHPRTRRLSRPMGG